MRRKMLAAATVAVMAVTATAEFRAAELVYVPIAAHNEGAEGSVWRTDLSLFNPGAAEIDVALFFLPSGRQDNSGRVDTLSDGLGGSADDGFGFVDEALAGIPPFGTVVIDDVLGSYWTEDLPEDGKGALVVFAWESGTLDPVDPDSRVPADVIVTSRTYDQGRIVLPGEDGGDPVETDATFGQTIPGVPWYELADAAERTEERDLTGQFLVGARSDATSRFNVGVLNASDVGTSLAVEIRALGPDGETLVDGDGTDAVTRLILPPLAVVQLDRVLVEELGLEGDLRGITVVVGEPTWTSESATVFAGFTSYGSIVDDRSNDPTTVLPAFGEPYPVDCVWGSAGETLATAAVPGVDVAPAARPPLALPPRR